MSFLGLGKDGWINVGIGAATGAALLIPGVNLLAGAAIVGVGLSALNGHMSYVEGREQKESQRNTRDAQNAANRKTMSRQRQSITLQKNRAREAAAINSMAQGSAAKTNEHFTEVANRKVQNQVELLSKTEHSRAQRYYGKSLH